MSFSELNPTINYNRMEPNSYLDEYGGFDYVPSFNKTQDVFKYKNNQEISLNSKMNRVDSSDVAKIYFSDENIDRIQKKIRREVYNRSKGKFILETDQDAEDLQIVMGKVIEEHGKSLPHKVIHQVKLLNNYTVEYVVPDMITNIKQYYGYIKDITSPLKTIDRPMNVNNSGRNTLPSVTSVWQ